MSHSLKHHPFAKEAESHKRDKQLANQRARAAQHVAERQALLGATDDPNVDRREVSDPAFFAGSGLAQRAAPPAPHRRHWWDIFGK